MSGSTSRGSLTKEGASEYDAEEGDFDEEDGSSYNENKPRDFLVTTVRGDGYGGGGPSTTPHHSSKYANNTINNNAPFLPLQSHNYEPEESEIWRAHMTMIHIRNRGQWWTTSKLRKLKQWLLTFVIGVVQAVIASRCNSWSRKLSAIKFMHVRALLLLGLSYYENDENPEGSNYNDSWMMNYGGVEYYGDDGSSSSSNATMIGIEGQDTSEEQFVFNNTNYTINASKEGMHSTTFSSSMNDSQLDLDAYWFNFGGSPFLAFLFYQTIFAFIASLFTYIEPVSAGSGIPEVKV